MIEVSLSAGVVLAALVMLVFVVSTVVMAFGDR
jgi:hypothetical protein